MRRNSVPTLARTDQQHLGSIVLTIESERWEDGRVDTRVQHEIITRHTERRIPQADTVTDRLANPPRLFREVERRIARQVLDGLSQVLSVDGVQPEWSGLERDIGAVAGRELDLTLLLANADRGRETVNVHAQIAVR